MRKRYTSDSYRRALCSRLIWGQRLKEAAVSSILGSALAVKQFEDYLTATRSEHVLTQSEKHQLRLAYETKEKLLDVVARFEASVTEEMLTQSTKARK